MNTNFTTLCTSEEACEISRYVTADIIMQAAQCFAETFDKIEDTSRKWKMFRAIGAVYTLGYVSGGRSVRNK